MSIAKQRANSPRLSLVARTSAAVTIPATHEATTAAATPEGWFEDAVGYIGETPAGSRVLIDTDRQRSE